MTFRILRASLALVTLACSVEVAATGVSAGDADTTSASPDEGFLGYDVEGATLVLRFERGAAGSIWTLEQGAVRVRVDLRGDAVRIPGDVAAGTFDALAPGTVAWRFDRPDGTKTKGSVEVGERFATYFDSKRSSGLTITGLPAHVALGETITVTGVAGPTAIEGMAYAGHPLGHVGTIRLGDRQAIGPNEPFSFELSAIDPGLVVVELTLSTGMPAVFLPMYCGDTVPLTPPELDRPASATTTVDETAFAAEIGGYVNDLRSSLDLGVLAQHPILMQTADDKATDMVVNHYLAHKSLATGDGAVERTAKAGLKGEVAEEFGVEFNPRRAFLAWYGSPISRFTLLNSTWRTFGVGAARSDSGQGELVFVLHVATTRPP